MYNNNNIDLITDFMLRKLKSAPKYLKQKGIKAFWRKIKLMLFPVQTKTVADTEKQYIFITPKLDQTGSAIVLIDMVREYKSKFGNENLLVITEEIDHTNLKTLERFGISHKLYDINQDNELFMAQLNLNYNDFILFNTTHIAWNVRDYFLKYLTEDKIEKIHWYVHEDLPEKEFADKRLKTLIPQLVDEGKMEMWMLADRIKTNYEEYLGIETKLVPYRFKLHKAYTIKRQAKDFDKLHFIVNGNAHDNRKGQVNILTSFIFFHEKYFKNSPEKYRDFELTFMGLGDDYVSKGLIVVGEQFLDERFNSYKRMPRKDTLKITKQGNITISYSYMEALPLNVFEGMYMGHPIIRNDSSGMKEQLVKDKNGFYVKTDEIINFVSVIRKILSKDKVSNQDLVKMSRYSQKIARKYQDNSYIMA